MTETSEVGYPSLLDQILVAEAEIFYQRQHALFVANLFDSSILKHPDQNIGERYKEELATCMTMNDRLGLFMRRDYLPVVKSLDLGYTTSIQDHDEQDRLIVEFSALADVLIRNDVITCVDPRDESQRRIQFRHDGLVVGSNAPKTPNWSIGDRNRTLFKLQADGYIVTLAKRTTFAVEKKITAGMTNHNGEVTKSSNIRILEQYIDDRDDCISPIGTVYYAAKKLLLSKQ